ncbi:lysophospholipase L1-like esterase [Opitutaceae bacterium TAV1]|nr:lysophospholipase L1-like esterase [Opitutaceae bacterium TAV1]
MHLLRRRSLPALFLAMLPFVPHTGAAAATGSPATSSQPAVVLVFGDSITQGQSLATSNPGAMWLNRINASPAAAGKLRLVNEGKGGRPTDSLGEFDTVLARHRHIDALVIALGANDARDTSGNCVPNAVANLTRMVERARAVYGDALPVLIVAPTNINKFALGPSKPIANEREANINALETAYRKLAGKLDASFASLNNLIAPESLTADGVHPDAAGHAAIAQKLLPAALALVSRSLPDRGPTL